MNIHTIVLGVVAVLLIYLVYIYFFSSSNTATLVSYHDATQQLSIAASSLPSGATANYTFSIWFFINEWNYRYGQEKVIFQREDQNKDPAPKVSLDATTNNLIVSLATYPSSAAASASDASLFGADPTVMSIAVGEFAKLSPSEKAQVQAEYKVQEVSRTRHDPSLLSYIEGDITKALSSDPTGKINVCSIESVPIQTWTNLIMTLNNRALDLYLDGKLVRTCVLPGVPKLNPASNIQICPNGGFSGYISNFSYIANAINPTQAYDIYKQGYGGGSGVGNFFDKYRIKVAFVENNKEVNSFEL